MSSNCMKGHIIPTYVFLQAITCTGIHESLFTTSYARKHAFKGIRMIPSSHNIIQRYIILVSRTGQVKKEEEACCTAKVTTELLPHAAGMVNKILDDALERLFLANQTFPSLEPELQQRAGTAGDQLQFIDVDL